jgi:hypothetical protein
MRDLKFSERRKEIQVLEIYTFSTGAVTDVLKECGASIIRIEQCWIWDHYT